MPLTHLVILIVFGPLAGFIDSIAGGGGLITLPVLSMAVGPGAHAIGTNKIVGLTGAFMALLVYALKSRIPWARCFAFTLWVILGSALGSHLTPLIPVNAFRWFLAVTCPLILWVVWQRDLWIAHERDDGIRHKRERLNRLSHFANFLEPRVLVTGFCCGLYDGMWGPGGGTFMLLGLLFAVRLPLLAALGASKFANTASASMALLNFWSRGYVHWFEGCILALGMALGAFFGAHFVSRKSAHIVRPLLAVVASLLAVKILLNR